MKLRKKNTICVENKVSNYKLKKYEYELFL